MTPGALLLQPFPSPTLLETDWKPLCHQPLPSMGQRTPCISISKTHYLPSQGWVPHQWSLLPLNKHIHGRSAPKAGGSFCLNVWQDSTGLAGLQKDLPRLEPQVLALFKVSPTTPGALVPMPLCAAPQEWEGEEFRPPTEPGRKQSLKPEQS